MAMAIIRRRNCCRHFLFATFALILALQDMDRGAARALLLHFPVRRPPRILVASLPQVPNSARPTARRSSYGVALMATAPSPQTSNDHRGPIGSGSSDSVSREGFLAGATSIVVAALAPGVLTEPRGPPSYDVMQERIFDTRKSSFLPADPAKLIVPGAGFKSKVVCLGETHTHPLHHRMQFNVLKATHAVTQSSGEPLAVGLEMFYRQQQVTTSCTLVSHDTGGCVMDVYVAAVCVILVGDNSYHTSYSYYTTTTVVPR